MAPGTGSVEPQIKVNMTYDLWLKYQSSPAPFLPYGDQTLAEIKGYFSYWIGYFSYWIEK